MTVRHKWFLLPTVLLSVPPRSLIAIVCVALKMYEASHGGFYFGALLWSVLPFFLQKMVGLTPKSHKIAQGSAPVGSKNSPGPRNEAPDRFGEGRKFWIFFFISIFWSIFFIGGNTLTSKIAYPEQNRTCHITTLTTSRNYATRYETIFSNHAPRCNNRASHVLQVA